MSYKLDNIIAERKNKTVYKDGDKTIKLFCENYSKADLYSFGLSGGGDSSKRRDDICQENGLPTGMSANAFLSAVNLLGIKID